MEDRTIVTKATRERENCLSSFVQVDICAVKSNSSQPRLDRGWRQKPKDARMSPNGIAQACWEDNTRGQVSRPDNWTTEQTTSKSFVFMEVVFFLRLRRRRIAGRQPKLPRMAADCNIES